MYHTGVWSNGTMFLSKRNDGGSIPSTPASIVMNSKTTNVQHLSSHQYASADKLHARWDLYQFAIPRIDTHQTGIDHLQLKGNENILEVGCGDGSVLVNLRRGGHTGKLIGLEINAGMFRESVAAQKNANLQPPIEFIVGSADNLPFPDQSFDSMLAFFMLYHMPDIQKTLYEWKRVLRDGGTVLVATGSSFSRPKHKVFKKMVEDLIDTTSPPQFSSSFNLENAEEQLQGVFKIVDTFVHEGQIKIERSEPYVNAFSSLRDMYEPIPSDTDWQAAERAVRTEIDREIVQNGFFTDSIKRGFFICEKI